MTYWWLYGRLICTEIFLKLQNDTNVDKLCWISLYDIVYVDCISIVASTLQMSCDIDNEERIFVNQVSPCQNAFALE